MRRTRLAWVLAAAIAAAVVQARAGLAQPTTPPVDDTAAEEVRLSRARSLFEEGLAFVEQKQWQDAAQRFEEVLRIRTSNVVTYNLAFALVQLGRLTEAAELLRPIAHDAATGDVASDTARQLLSEIEPRIASVTVRLSGDPSDARVFVGSRSLALDHLGRPINVDPGRLNIRVERNGAVVVARDVEVGGAYPPHVEVTLEVPPIARRSAQPIARQPQLQPQPTRAGPVGATQADAPITSKAWFWVAGGGLVAAATATVLVVALSGGSSARDPVEGDAGTIAGRVMPIP